LISSDNAGLDKNSWGNEPVCKFYTDENSIYNFSFHETADKEKSVGDYFCIIVIVTA
jgi:type IV secretory pathway VirB4 component